jgi:deoxyribodipyrimidine photo-lyase
LTITAVVWLRRDLRLADNPALARAAELAERVVPVYIHAPHEEAPWQPGGASRWWLHQGLAALEQSLRQRGSRLLIAAGDSLAELRRIAAAAGARHVLWNRLYDPWAVHRDAAIKQALRADGYECASFNAGLLLEPWEVRTTSGDPYRVFSAFWRQVAPRLAAIEARPTPAVLPPPVDGLARLELDALGLLPRIRWDTGLAEHWQPGAASAEERARAFLSGPVDGYTIQRDLPAQPGTSRLSPHLHFGEIGPRQVLALTRAAGHDPGAGPAGELIRELGWREFAHHLLYHFPHTAETPLDPRFADFPWRTEGADRLLAAWQRGRTGIPLVDAGMRELWHTGFMHNRVRMVVASLLTKNLRLPWIEGARWFWDTLVDADLASNTLGWQWTAGCGADAAPYFRVFNPVRQGERFDPEGEYVCRWCPELARLPSRYIHQPWAAPPAVLSAAGLTLGRDYPIPIVDLDASRKEALAAWGHIKGGA